MFPVEVGILDSKVPFDAQAEENALLQESLERRKQALLEHRLALEHEVYMSSNYPCQSFLRYY